MVCENCHGTGVYADWRGDTQTHWKCGGTGWLPDPTPDAGADAEEAGS